MRKFTCLLLCIIILLCSAACQSPDTPSTQLPPSTPAPSSSTSNTDDPPLQTLYALSVPNQAEYQYSEDGAVIFEYAYQHIQLHTPDQSISDKIILDFLTRVDQTRSNADAIAEQALADYTGTKNWSPYKYHIYYSPTRVDGGIISMFGTRTTYTGGLHPEQSCVSVSYDAASGTSLTLGSILNHVDNKQDLCNLVLEELEKVNYQYSLFDGYESVVAERFAADESTDEAFYFTDSGLCFFFAPYELAPFSTGIISVEIPYSKLPGILSDAYFPDEYQPSTGTLIAEKVGDTDVSSFTQLIETSLDPEGERVLFYSDKSIQKLTITHGSWTPDGLYFIPDHIVFSTTGVSSDRAIIIRMSIPDVLPNLMVSYETQNHKESFYIYMSGEDGSILLLPVE